MSTLIGLVIALCCAPSAVAHYAFGWSFSGPNGEPDVHAVEGAGDGFTTVYNFDGHICHPDPPEGPNNCAPPTYSSCDAFDVHDEPVRVFRFQGGDGPRLQMNLGVSRRNRRYIGTTLENLAREQQLGPTIDPDGDESRPCATNTVYLAPGGGPPWNFNQDEWVTSPYHVSGPSPAVYALMHVEFRGTKYNPAGTEDPIEDYCDTGVHNNCWMGSTTLAKSGPQDADSAVVNRLGAEYGSSSPSSTGFHGGKNSIVATLPQQYIPDWGFLGYAAITNIIKKDGYYYYVGGTQGSPAGQPEDERQPGGVCVFRTANLDDPTSWRAWDGQGFNTRYLSPYQGADPYPWSAALSPEQRREQICKSVQADSAPLFPVRQLTYNENLKKYMLMGKIDATGDIAGIYYSLSDDLINWSPRQVLLAAPKVREPDAQGVNRCAQEETLRYPVILDPDDAASVAEPSVADVNTNFDHPDRTAYLFAPRAPCLNSTGGNDLVRTPIKFMQRSASLEPPTGPTDAWSATPQNDYDSTSGIYFSKLNTGPGYGYGEPGDGWTGLATSWPYGDVRQAYGQHNARWNNGDDVWYGSAFKIPTNFVADNAGVQIMSWHTAAGAYGGITLAGTDNKWHVIRGGGGYIGQAFDLPTNRWTWLEVHQKLGTTSGGGTLTEVFVDGRLVSTTDAANRTDSATITKVLYGIVWNNTVGGPASTQAVEVDRSSISGGQLGALRGGELYRAPPTPLGLRTVTDDTTHINLMWNDASPVAGYRIYEQQSNGTWAVVGSPVTGTSVRLSVSSCSTHTYRITAYRDHGADPLDWTESVVSTPLVATPDGCS